SRRYDSLRVLKKTAPSSIKRGAAHKAAVIKTRSAAGQNVRSDPASRINRLGDGAIVIAGNDDRISVGIDAADDAHVTAAAPTHDRDCADLGPTHARAIARVGLRQVAATGMAGALKDQIHERATP